MHHVCPEYIIYIVYSTVEYILSLLLLLVVVVVVVLAVVVVVKSSVCFSFVFTTFGIIGGNDIHFGFNCVIMVVLLIGARILNHLMEADSLLYSFFSF